MTHTWHIEEHKNNQKSSIVKRHVGKIGQLDRVDFSVENTRQGTDHGPQFPRNAQRIQGEEKGIPLKH